MGVFLHAILTPVCTPEDKSLRRWQDSSSENRRYPNESTTRVEMGGLFSLFQCFGASDCSPRVLFGEFAGTRSSVVRWLLGTFSRLLRVSARPSFYPHCFRVFNVSSRQLVKLLHEMALKTLVLSHVMMAKFTFLHNRPQCHRCSRLWPTNVGGSGCVSQTVFERGRVETGNKRCLE